MATLMTIMRIKVRTRMMTMMLTYFFRMMARFI